MEENQPSKRFLLKNYKTKESWESKLMWLDGVETNTISLDIRSWGEKARIARSGGVS